MFLKKINKYHRLWFAYNLIIINYVHVLMLLLFLFDFFIKTFTFSSTLYLTFFLHFIKPTKTLDVGFVFIATITWFYKKNFVSFVFIMFKSYVFLFVILILFLLLLLLFLSNLYVRLFVLVVVMDCIILGLLEMYGKLRKKTYSLSIILMLPPCAEKRGLVSFWFFSVF